MPLPPPRSTSSFFWVAGPSNGEVLRHIIRTDGALALYWGVLPALLKGVLSSGLMLLAKERISSLVRIVLLALLGKSKAKA